MTQAEEARLLDRLQRETLRYFWDFAHPVSGLAGKRSDLSSSWYGPEVVTSGGSGFGIMALIAGADRGWLARRQVARRILGMLDFLSEADSLSRRLPALHQRRDRQGRPLQPEGRWRRSRRDVVPDDGRAFRAAVFRSRRPGGAFASRCRRPPTPGAGCRVGGRPFRARRGEGRAVP